jgi:three-Cys-motif partner protein
MAKDFHEKPFDAATLAKLQILELYAQEWIPVFLSPDKPVFDEVHVFDFFAGPGKDVEGLHGSPLRTLSKLREYHGMGLAGWHKVPIVVHLFDEAQDKIAKLQSLVHSPEWKIPGVQPDCRTRSFRDALAEHESVLANSRIAKLLIIDQCGVDAVSDDIFQRLISFPRTDFIFFISSSSCTDSAITRRSNRRLKICRIPMTCTARSSIITGAESRRATTCSWVHFL